MGRINQRKIHTISVKAKKEAQTTCPKQEQDRVEDVNIKILQSIKAPNDVTQYI